MPLQNELLVAAFAQWFDSGQHSYLWLKWPQTLTLPGSPQPHFSLHKQLERVIVEEPKGMVEVAALDLPVVMIQGSLDACYYCLPD